jgi:hypothetical protein
MSGKPFWAFTKALRADWFAAMSGGFSVPFAAMGVFADPKYQPQIWWALAGLAFGFAAYRLWRAEFDKVVSLEKQLNGEQHFARDVNLSEAVAYVCFREWGKTFGEAAGSSPAVEAATAYDKSLQAAADGKIPIWGKREPYGVHEPIPREYWFTNRFEWFDLLKGKPSSEPSKGAFKGDSYSSLMTSKEAVASYL